MGNGAVDEAERFQGRIFRVCVIVAAIVVLVSAAFAGSVGGSAVDFFQIAGSAIALAAASALIGAILGFLFGIPHAMQRGPSPADGGGPAFAANTNLEQISDWVTKILVGVSLIQIGKVAPALGQLAISLKPMLGNDEASPGFGLAICLFAVLAGFLLTYLWTRVSFWQLLEWTTDSVLNFLKKKDSADADAMLLLSRQLSGQKPAAEELGRAFAQASRATLVQIYQQAEDQRSQTWRATEPWKRERHDYTIPVFRALTENNPEKNHRYYGSWGFALKDQASRVLDEEAESDRLYGEAIDKLTTAIKLRDDADQGGFPLYEWCRAACRIRMGGPAASQELITADLRTAATRGLSDRFFEPPLPGDDDTSTTRVAEWLEQNDLSYAALRG